MPSLRDRMQRADPIWRRIIQRGVSGPTLARTATVNGGAAGDIAVTDIKAGDQLIGVSFIPLDDGLRRNIQAGAAAGNHTVTGIAVEDRLVSVARLDRDATAANINLTNITSEFTISAPDTINNGGGTNTTGDALDIVWRDKSVGEPKDLRSQFTIRRDGIINNAGGTATTGGRLVVTWLAIGGA